MGLRLIVEISNPNNNHINSTQMQVSEAHLSMAKHEEVKLLGLWVSPFSRRVEWALKLKGVDYEYIEQDVFNKSPLLLDLNPVTKKVPVLVHNGRPMFESFLLLEYIDETWTQNPLLPRDPYGRAMARFWADFGEKKIMEAAFNVMLAKEGDEKDTRAEIVMEGLEKLEAELNGKKWFGGESIGYLDIALGWISRWIPVWEQVGSMQLVDPTKFPALSVWMSNFVNHPAIKGSDVLPDRDRMVAFFHGRVDAITSLSLGSVKF